MDYVNCIVCKGNDLEVKWEKNGYTYNVCKDCGLVFINPRPSQKELVDYYNNNYQVNKRRYLGRKKKWLNIVKLIKKHIDHGRLLEIGCSYGLFLKTAKNSGFEVKGIEISDDAVRHAKEKFELDVVCGDLQNILKEISSGFDIICMWHTIEHLIDPDKTFRMLRNQLNDNGLLVLTTPNVKSLPARRLGMFWEWVNPPKHLFLFDNNTISRLLEEQGYKIIDIFTREGDYKAFLLSMLTRPIREKKYLHKISQKMVKEQAGDTGRKGVQTHKKKSNGWLNYFNLRMKEIFGMDFIFRHAYSSKNLGPEIFIIAKKV